MAVLHTIKSRFNNKLVHPGVILREEYLRTFDISQSALARHMGVSPRRINEIVLGKRAITVNTALGLAEVFGLSPHYWMALQADYDIETARALRPPRDWRLKPRCASREYASDPFDAPTVPDFGGYGMGTPKLTMTRGAMDSRNSRGKKR